MCFQGGFFKVWGEGKIPKPPKTQPKDFSFEFKFLCYVLPITPSCPPLSNPPVSCVLRITSCCVLLQAQPGACQPALTTQKELWQTRWEDRRAFRAEGRYLSGGDRLVHPRAFAGRGAEVHRGALWGAGLPCGEQGCRSAAAHGRAPLLPPAVPLPARRRTRPGKKGAPGRDSRLFSALLQVSLSFSAFRLVTISCFTIRLLDGVPVAQVQLYCC